MQQKHIRKYKNCSPLEQKSLLQQFHFISDLDWGLDVPEIYTAAISVFDHWLTVKEAGEMLENVDSITQDKREALHRAFNHHLVTEYRCLRYRYTGRGKKVKPIFKSFNSLKVAKDYVDPSPTFISARFKFRIVIPELSAIYIEGEDYTSYFYSKRKDVLALVSSIAESYELNLLK